MKALLRLLVAGVFLGLVLGLANIPLAAQESLPDAPLANRQLSDPAQEREARRLMETLRCLTCQGQSIADSDAPIAGDMRHLVRSRIAAGERPEAIRAWLAARYGEYISYRPPLSGATWPLFAVPLAIALLVAVLLRRRFARRPPR